MKKNLYKYLAGNDYPGRGIVLGKSPDGQKAFVAYWIMGRSANSRNRVFEPIDGGIRTVAADPAKLEDPHLIIYNAVLTLRETTVVTNGDQTDTIARFMNGNLFPGYSFEAALATRTYEDDAPNFTPRISGVVDMRRGGYKLSIVKSDEGNAESVQRQTFDYPQPVAGEGHFISTYVKNGAPIPSFAGEPLRVAIDTNDADKFADKLWVSLNEDNKVSLFVRSIELETGEYEDFGVPATILANYLRAHGVVPEKCDLNSILFLLTPSQTTAKISSLTTQIARFERLLDANAPMKEVIPQVYRDWEERYEGYCIRELCQEMHDFSREFNIKDLQKAMFRREHFPKAVMSAQQANFEFMRGNAEYIPLAEAEGRIALEGALPYPPGVICCVPGEIWGGAVKAYFEALAVGVNRFPGFAPELQGVYLEANEDGEKRIWVNVLKECRRRELEAAGLIRS